MLCANPVCQQKTLDSFLDSFLDCFWILIWMFCGRKTTNCSIWILIWIILLLPDWRHIGTKKKVSIENLISLLRSARHNKFQNLLVTAKHVCFCLVLLFLELATKKKTIVYLCFIPQLLASICRLVPCKNH